MSEKEKMLAGELYDANYNKDLIEDRNKIKDKCFEYNNIKPSDIENRKKIMKTILGKTKENFLIENLLCAIMDIISKLEKISIQIII